MADELSGARIGWRLRRRAEVPRATAILFRIAAVLAALLVGGIAITLSGLPALALGRRALISTFGSAYGWEQAAVLATPLILTGLAIALCLKLRLWNLGAEGQLFMGAWAATALGIHFTESPPALMFAAMFVAAAIVGALWILLPALARAYLNVSELLTTLMLNFVAILWVNHFAIGPWRDRGVGVLTATYRIPYELPLLSGQLHIGIFVALALALFLAVTIQNTRWGYEIKTIGGNRRAAEFAGIPVNRTIFAVMLLSGAIAGIAGMIEVTGTTHRLSGTISNEYGYMGIIAAALANASFYGTLLAGFLLAALLNAGIVLQTQGLSINAVVALNGLILLFAAVGEVLAHYRLVRVETEIIPAVPGEETQAKRGEKMVEDVIRPLPAEVGEIHRPEEQLP